LTKKISSLFSWPPTHENEKKMKKFFLPILMIFQYLFCSKFDAIIALSNYLKIIKIPIDFYT
jgi:hypothetical protein